MAIAAMNMRLVEHTIMAIHDRVDGKNPTESINLLLSRLEESQEPIIQHIFLEAQLDSLGNRAKVRANREKWSNEKISEQYLKDFNTIFPNN